MIGSTINLPFQIGYPAWKEHIWELLVGSGSIPISLIVRICLCFGVYHKYVFCIANEQFRAVVIYTPRSSMYDIFQNSPDHLDIHPGKLT